MENKGNQSVSNETKKSSVGKIIGIVVACFVVLFGVIFSIGYSMTGALVRTSDAFFESVDNNDYETAYTYLASTIQDRSVTLDNIEKYLVDYNAVGIVDSTWSGRHIEGKFGNLVGTVAFEDGTVMPYRVNLIKEVGEWKILGFVSDYDVDEITKAVQKMPSQVSKDVVQNTMELFYEAIEGQDFSTFYAEIAESWKLNMASADLDEAFIGYFGKGFLLNPVNEVPLVILTETTDEYEDGNFITYEIEYAGLDYVVTGELEYAIIDGEHKLYGIYVDSK